MSRARTGDGVEHGGEGETANLTTVTATAVELPRTTDRTAKSEAS